ncbi:hypothetical protein PR048_012809 [Dryococelus australis]|uniref:PiggyBac transposable element-derived protein domain-containing protein n=1 Tax=Dryococelus australis TaxID=614101 RepID=A0ABQ9HQT9_9NEOP|nr:hypothetical protein PR048_012809 [Dryococelus australis]
MLAPLYKFIKDMTLVFFVLKKGNAVLSISSMHHSNNEYLETGKPKKISLFNNTKGGVDSLDQMIVNMAAINDYSLHQSYRDRTVLPILLFMKIVVKQLTHKFLVNQSKNAR